MRPHSDVAGNGSKDDMVANRQHAIMVRCTDGRAVVWEGNGRLRTWAVELNCDCSARTHGLFTLSWCSAGRTAPAPHKGRRLKLLLAEDNPTNRYVAVRMLTRMGHAVDAVENGAQAVRAVAAADYDAILMDMMMPEVDGITATRMIRAAALPHGDHRADRQRLRLRSCRVRGGRHERFRDKASHDGAVIRGGGANCVARPSAA
jgi:hypothetical protein